MSKYSTNKVYKIRPHHMLCLQFFEGKGYSKEFVDNMMKIKNELETQNPLVEIVNQCDDICENCPNRCGDKCKDEKSIKDHDNRVYQRVCDYAGKLSYAEGGLLKNLSWNEITEIVYQSIINPQKVKETCVHCMWSDICFEKGNCRVSTIIK